MRRRTFIKTLAGAIGAGAIGCRGTTEQEAASKLPWGHAEGAAADLVLPSELRPEGMLEVFLMGGLCPWDTFYVVPEHGRPDAAKPFRNTQWWTFQEGKSNVHSVFEQRCGGTGDLLMPWHGDSLDRQVNLGPWLYLLRDRPDILARTRVLVMQHPFEPHEVASPLALCGHTRGELRMASTGAHLQRHYNDLLGRRPEPYAYTIFSGDSEIEAQFDINAASASGLHPASSRPLQIRLSEDNSRLAEQLRRAALGEWGGRMDALVDHYAAAYHEQLRLPGTDLRHHSQSVQDYLGARRTLRDGDAVAAMLPPEVLAPRYGHECGDESELDTTFMGMQLATHLLTHPTRRARYVNYVDSGILNATGAGYDTHEHHVVESSRNVIHLTKMLKAFINAPGEANPGKLDLDRHMVMLTTEFGRTPQPEIGKPLGLDHWPFGYVVVAIGGPVSADRSGVVGAIGEDGYAVERKSVSGPDRFLSFSPAELRAAMLMAMGIWPFYNEGFAVGDIRGATSEEHAAQILRTKLWGVPLG